MCAFLSEKTLTSGHFPRHSVFGIVTRPHTHWVWKLVSLRAVSEGGEIKYRNTSAVSSAGGAKTMRGIVLGGCHPFRPKKERVYNLNRPCKGRRVWDTIP